MFIKKKQGEYLPINIRWQQFENNYQKMEELKNRLREFANERNWDQFHSPKNLVMALNGEIGELTEIFQWLDIENSKLENPSLNSRVINLYPSY